MTKSTYIIIVSTILTILTACDGKHECKQFDYNQFGIDTSTYKKPMVYVNSLDTLTFENKEFICEQKEFSKPSSFFNADECKNGFVSSYYSKKLDLEFTYFIMTYDDWSDFSISSIHFIKDARNPKGKNDLNIQIDSVDIINKPSPVKTLTFKHGLLQSFIDSSNKIWTKVEIAN